MTAAPRAMSRHDSKSLYVDLDKSLISTDTLWESLIVLFKGHPFALLKAPVWLLKGKAGFKAEVAKLVIPDVSLLPYRKNVVSFIEQRRADGVDVILATAANDKIAHAVSKHLGVFTDVLASDASTNLSGSRKSAAIRKTADNGEFEYIGDTWVDVPIWQAAKSAIVVDGPSRLISSLKREMPVRELTSEHRSTIFTMVRALRCHQWIKNILIFVPMILAHQVIDSSHWMAVCVAFICFSLIASSVYVVNDILDIESDRSHPQKKKRPFAAGELQIKTGVILATVLFALGAGVSSVFISTTFGLMAASYAVVSFAYSSYFKRQPILDLLLLAGFYTYRVVLGGAALPDAAVSEWLYGFSVFFFMSLAMVKRYADLLELEKIGQTEAKGRYYTAQDLPLFCSLGPATGCMSIFVLAMYLNSEKVTTLYNKPMFLWFICPTLFYWIARVWFLAIRGELSHDPIVFALRDKISYAVAILSGCFLLLADPNFS